MHIGISIHVSLLFWNMVLFPINLSTIRNAQQIEHVHHGPLFVRPPFGEYNFWPYTRGIL